MKDENEAVRQDAAQALGKIGDPRAVGALTEVLKDEDEAVRRAAAEALKKITGKDFGMNALKWRQWFEETYQKK